MCPVLRDFQKKGLRPRSIYEDGWTISWILKMNMLLLKIYGTVVSIVAVYGTCGHIVNSSFIDINYFN